MSSDNPLSLAMNAKELIAEMVAYWDRCEIVVLRTDERLMGFGGALVGRFFAFAGSL